MLKKVVYFFTLVLIIVALSQHVTNDYPLRTKNQEDVTPVQSLPKHEASIVTRPLDLVGFTRPEQEAITIRQQIADMSVDDKLGQMVIAGISGMTINATTKSIINDLKVGGLIFYENNLQTPKQTVQLLNAIKLENRKDNNIPLFLTIDQEGGSVSKLPGDVKVLPINKEVGKTNDASYSYQIGKMLGRQVRAFGFNVDYAPVLDVDSNPDNPVIGDRSFSSQPKVVSKLGVQTMKGIQSQHVIPVVKHFPGHGDTSVDSHLELPKVNKSVVELYQEELIPFKQAIEHGADAVMVAHILLPKLDEEFPATMSKSIITNLLRTELGFNGVVMTDDLTMKAITENYTIGQAAVKSIKAGSDIVMVAHDYEKLVAVMDALKQAVNDGDLTEQRLNQSVARILTLKRSYDLNHDQINEVNIADLNQQIN